MERTNTVADIEDSDLVHRAMRNLYPRRRMMRWAAVSATFALGSTYAQQLCVRFGLDPDETIGASECEGDGA